MGNEARKARKKAGVKHVKPSKTPTATYRTRREQQESRRRARETEAAVWAALPGAVAEVQAKMWARSNTFGR